MNSRLSQRSTLALVAYFLLITAVCAPVAYNIGKSRKAAAEAEASLSGTDGSPDYQSLADALNAGAACSDTDPAYRRHGVWEVFCHPYSGDGAGGAGGRPLLAAADESASQTPVSVRHASPARTPRIANAGNAATGEGGPLQQAVLRALAGGNDAALGGGAGETGDPFSLAMAPGLAPGGSLSPGGGWGPGAVPPSGGLPGVLVPGGPSPFAPGTPPVSVPQPPFTPPPSIPPSEPPAGPPTGEPPLVTPVPPALPLMLAGIGGLAAASRRKRTATTR